ncbi:MAG: tRNA pseudouridine(55) synthase TruB [Coriobacteriales bacterium]|jgi:tRNA pseudouridine55 synthase|nr:tRNA pseudouridine(55) synthase TruB [Coriobacteriales bacterium]
MSKPKRGATDLGGLILVDKPVGVTSFDVVRRIKNETGEGRVGHAGTLDPFASGLLLICIGPATKYITRLQDLPKTYLARIAFGQETDSGDLTGKVLRSAPLPAQLRQPAFARAQLARLVGPLMQVPPQYSAVKVGGQPAYRAARAGHEVRLKARQVEVYQAELVECEATSWLVRFTVSKGTYIRALARDLGQSLGSAAHLKSLRRERIGDFGVEQAGPEIISYAPPHCPVYSLAQLRAQTGQAKPAAVLVMGVFDGMHSGHRRLITAAIARARDLGKEAWAVTFDKDPDDIFHPGQRKLLSDYKRLEKLSQSGLDGILALPVPEVLAFSPERFVRECLEPCFEVVELEIGEGFRFGVGACGSAQTLTELGLDVCEHPLYRYEGAPVSATRIRAAYAAGDDSLASRMLYA